MSESIQKWNRQSLTDRLLDPVFAAALAYGTYPSPLHHSPYIGEVEVDKTRQDIRLGDYPFSN